MAPKGWKTICISVTPTEWHAFKMLAGIEGLNVSEYIKFKMAEWLCPAVEQINERKKENGRSNSTS